MTMFDFLKNKKPGIEKKEFNGKEFIMDSSAHDPKLFKDRKRVLMKTGYSTRVERRGIGEYILWSVKKQKGGVKNA